MELPTSGGRDGKSASPVAKGVREGVTPTGNQHPQPQDPTLKRECRIMRRTRAQGREARGGIGVEEEGKGKEADHASPIRIIFGAIQQFHSRGGFQ